MKLRNWPTTTEETRRRVIELARRGDGQKQVAHVRFLARKHHKLVPLFGRVDLARKGDLTAPPRYEGQDILTLSEVMSVPDFIGRLDRAMAGNPFECNDHILEDHGLTGQWLQAEHPRGEYSCWPTSAVYVDAHTESPPPVDSPVLVKTGKVFGDLDQLRAAFAHFSTDHLHCDARRNKILIVFWDYRGRIRLVKEGLPHTLEVHVEGDRLEDLKLTGQVDTATCSIPVEYCGEAQIPIALSSAPRSVELNLVLGVDTLLDRLREPLNETEGAGHDNLTPTTSTDRSSSLATHRLHPLETLGATSGTSNWDRVLEKVQAKVSVHCFNTWFKPTRSVSEHASIITVRTPNTWFTEWLKTKYSLTIRDAFRELGRPDLSVDFQPDSDTSEYEDSSDTHVFVSYVREDTELVKRLGDDLKSHGIRVWIDREQIQPGQRWQDAIRHAIETGGYFLACFSDSYARRDKSYMNEELTLAIDQLRRRATARTWFIPILLSACSVPDRPVGAGETLRDFHWLALYKDWDDGIRSIVSVVSPKHD